MRQGKNMPVSLCRIISAVKGIAERSLTSLRVFITFKVDGDEDIISLLLSLIQKHMPGNKKASANVDPNTGDLHRCAEGDLTREAYRPSGKGNPGIGCLSLEVVCLCLGLSSLTFM